jgi:vacuolar-type H+-ATPase subunit E/Vma4
VTGTALLDRVAHQADDEGARRLAAARDAAARIRDTGDRERAARRQRALDSRRAELNRAREDACADAVARTARSVLEARARWIDRVFTATEAATGRLAASSELSACMVRLLEGALAYADAAHCTVRCSGMTRPAVENALRSLSASEVTIVEDDSVPAGAIVESNDGRLVVDATLEGLLRRRREALSIVALGSATGRSNGP